MHILANDFYRISKTLIHLPIYLYFHNFTAPTVSSHCPLRNPSTNQCSGHFSYIGTFSSVHTFCHLKGGWDASSGATDVHTNMYTYAHIPGILFLHREAVRSLIINLPSVCSPQERRGEAESHGGKCQSKSRRYTYVYMREACPNPQADQAPLVFIVSDMKLSWGRGRCLPEN